MTKKYLLPSVFLLVLFTLLVPSLAHAMCPICTIAAGTGVVVMRDLGVDDTITGVWLGGLLMSTTLWTINWLRGKKINFWGRNYLTGTAYYAAVLIPFYQKNMISKALFGSHYQTLLGVDKLLLGIVAGSIFFLFGVITYNFAKKSNGGHAHFPFEKVVLPISPLIILSLIFYFLTQK